MPTAGRADPHGPEGPLEITVRRVGDRDVLDVAGEIDEWTSSQLLLAVRRALPGTGHVAVDLSGVSFIGSAGLSALLQLQAHAERHRQRLAIIGMSATVARAIDLCDLGDVLRLAATEYDADEGADQEGAPPPPGG